MDELTTLRYERDGRVARITLDRPERANGLTLDMARELEECVARAVRDRSVRVIALTGRGRTFCGGYDVLGSAEELLANPPANDGAPKDRVDPADPRRSRAGDWSCDPSVRAALVRFSLRGAEALVRASKPVICVVQGICLAAGADLALAADSVIMAADATLGYPTRPPTHEPRSYSARAALRRLLAGQCVTGREAFANGLVAEVTPADELDERFELVLGRALCLPVEELHRMKRPSRPFVPDRGPEHFDDPTPSTVGV